MIDNGLFSYAHPMLISIFVILFAALNAFIESIIIKRHIPLTKAFHTVKFWSLVAIALILYAYTNLLLHFTEIIVSMAAYWLFFDLFLNKFRGLSILYMPAKAISFFDKHVGELFFDPKFYIMSKFILWLVLGAISTALIGEVLG